VIVHALGIVAIHDVVSSLGELFATTLG